MWLRFVHHELFDLRNPKSEPKDKYHSSTVKMQCFLFIKKNTYSFPSQIVNRNVFASQNKHGNRHGHFHCSRCHKTNPQLHTVYELFCFVPIYIVVHRCDATCFQHQHACLPTSLNPLASLCVHLANIPAPPQTASHASHLLPETNCAVGII